MHEEAPSPWMTIPEAASYLRTSRAQVDQMLSAKTLTRHKVGRKTLIARRSKRSWPTEIVRTMREEKGRNPGRAAVT